jgi:hypothetical protein
MKLPLVTTALALVLSALIAGTAFAAQAKKVTFSATYAGTAVTKVSGNTIAYTASGKGLQSATGVGMPAGAKASKLVGLGKADKTNASDSGCAPFNGPATITSTAGKLKVTVIPTSRGCAASQDDQDNVNLSGSVKVSGGTGKFKTAHGLLKFSGHFNNSTGAFTVKLFKGTLTL